MKYIDKMAKNFEPQQCEQKIYQRWLDEKCFAAEVKPGKKRFSIVMPPPNITGHLHIGHALDLTLPDITVRYKRKQGFETLWLPGTDHASIATESKIVEAMKKEGLSKADLGREGFLERAWAWKKQYGDTINRQITRLGASCDWSRARFTMDPGLSHAVLKVFVDLYNKGLIYRGERIINWCPYCKTSISDIEVVYEEQQGNFWHLRYPLVDGSGELQLATTRPETLLGDTAVAVHPEDERYQHLIGKEVILPLVGRNIPIVADEYVEKDFGTGVVKITPAHDPNDFEVGLRHNLEVINVMNDDATINQNGGKYAGLSREEARKQIVADLEKEGYLLKVEPLTHNVGHCQRCHTTVEPRVSKQWFVKMEELAKPALEAAYSGDIRFVPERFSKLYYHWMENIRDWCISRQLWWGHRIPAWYCAQCGQITVSVEKPCCCEHCQSVDITQDEDTLDTWFSSALWPFATLGWPDKTPELEYFYPTNLLVTGYDILTFWVSRMIFSALEHTEQKPFDDVLLHGLIRDSQGRKISKSLGNGIDPLEIIDQFGADALRYALITGISPGNDLRFHDAKVEAGRNFINKVWNATRFVLMNIEDEVDPTELCLTDDQLPTLVVEDHWILHLLQELIDEVSRNIDSYEYGIGLSKIYNFLWDNFCDWYIELVKPRLRSDELTDRRKAQRVLLHVLKQSLNLLHPFMPFFTEEINSHLPAVDKEMLVVSEWPESKESYRFVKDQQAMDELMEAVRNIRNLRNEMNVPLGKTVPLYVLSKDHELADFIKDQSPKLLNLAKISEVHVLSSDTDIPANAVSIPLTNLSLYLPLTELVDVEQEKQRLGKEIAGLQQQIKAVESKLANENFISKAPEAVVNKEKAKLQEYSDKLQQAEQALAQLPN